MLRTSSYTIFVDLPEMPEYVLLVHGYTGANDRVSRSVADYLKSIAPRPAKPLHGEWSDEEGATTALPPSDGTLHALARRGYLTEKSVAEEEGYFARISKVLHRQKANSAATYIIMPTYSCNLRCGYCFQDYMRTNPAFQHLLTGMTPALVDRIFDAMPALEAERASSDGPRSIGLFGGEPLLAENRPAVEHIVRRAHAMGPTRLWAVSNATELEAYEDLLGPGGIGSVQVTLDGPPREHDRRRIHADGSGTFDEIARNIDLCLQSQVSIVIRLNLDRLNISDVPELAAEMDRRGWAGHPRFSVYAAPIRPANDKTDRATTFDSWELDQALAALHEEEPVTSIVGRQDSAITARARRLFDSRGDAIPEFRTSFCTAHTTMYIFDAFGDIYACWERTGDSRIRIGQVTEDARIELSGGMNKLWRTRTVASNPTCRKCKYAMHCGGGCAVLAEADTGRFHSNHCDGYAERFRHAVAQAFMDATLGVERAYVEQLTDL